MSDRRKSLSAAIVGLRARSAEGALIQVAVLAAVVCQLANEAGDDARCGDTVRAADTLLYSIAGVLGGIGGRTVAELGLEFYMPDGLDPSRLAKDAAA